jgi:hypothetical protein
VIGMRHVSAFSAAVAVAQAAPLTPPIRKNVRLVHLHPESLGEVLAEMPFYVAAYEARRRGSSPPRPAAEEPPAAGRDYGAFRVLSGGRGDDPGSRARRRGGRRGRGRRSDRPAAAAARAGGERLANPARGGPRRRGGPLGSGATSRVTPEAWRGTREC